MLQTQAGSPSITKNIFFKQKKFDQTKWGCPIYNNHLKIYFLVPKKELKGRVNTSDPILKHKNVFFKYVQKRIRQRISLSKQQGSLTEGGAQYS